MTQDKAREYFSAYHEGALEPGLVASLERKLQSDMDLRAEYDAFAATIVALEALRSESIEVPSYLNDRIASRLEGVREVSAQPFWVAWFRPRTAVTHSGNRFVWATGLAACLLLAAVGLRGMQISDSDTIDARLIGGPIADNLKWVSSSEGVVLMVPRSKQARTITIIPQGGDAKQFVLAARQGLEVTLSNPNRLARRFTVVSGDETLATVALPGSRTVAKKPGSGTVTEMASALADSYRLPVVIKTGAPTSTLRWSFDLADARAAADQGLDGQGGSAVMKDDNVLQIGR